MVVQTVPVRTRMIPRTTENTKNSRIRSAVAAAPMIVPHRANRTACPTTPTQRGATVARLWYR